MIWLNNGLSLLYSEQGFLSSGNQLEIFEESTPELMSDSEIISINIANLCSNVFKDLISKKISCEEACIQYSKIYSDNKSNQSYQFCGLCFRALILCFLSHSNDVFRDKDIKIDLLETARIIYENNKPSNEKSRICCDLAFNKLDDFQKLYTIKGGTKLVLLNLMKVHQTDNITWWLEDLMRFYTESNQLSDFDREFIDFLFSDIINCDNPFLTLAISIFFHFSTTTRKSLGEYAGESMSCFAPQDRILTGILKFGCTDKVSDKDLEFMKEINQLNQMPCFAVHFIHIIFCEISTNKMVKQEYRISVCRYLEILSNYYEETENDEIINLREYIPLFLSTIIEGEKSVEMSLQMVYPSIWKGLPQDLADKINKLPDYEISKYFNKSRQFMKEVKTVIDNKDFYEDYSKISHFLNNDFFGCNQKLKEEIVQTVTKDMNSDKNNENGPIKPKKESILNKIDDINESVIVSMMETYFEVEGHSDEKIELEQHLFDYIAEHGDLPEYTPSWE